MSRISRKSDSIDDGIGYDTYEIDDEIDDEIDIFLEIDIPIVLLITS
jgi:hypothetical protein